MFLDGLHGIARELHRVRRNLQSSENEQLVEQTYTADDLLNLLRNLTKVEFLREHGHLLRHAGLKVDQSSWCRSAVRLFFLAGIPWSCAIAALRKCDATIAEPCLL